MGIYNYTSFPLGADRQDFDRFPNVTRVGTKAPDGTLIDARNEATVQLSDIFRTGITVIEFGSYT